MQVEQIQGKQKGVLDEGNFIISIPVPPVKFPAIGFKYQRINPCKTRFDSYLLVFFGYTYCPDVCPTALNDMSEVLDELGASGNSIVPLFISVDPKRDTPEHLKSYVENFHPRFIGLTGTSAQIAAAAQSYKVRYIKMEDEDGDPETYYMGHSSKVFFVGPTGELLISFSGSTQPAEMKSKIANLLSGEGR